MRFIIYGAGAVGGVCGGRLAQAGADVVLIARGAHHDAIAADGLLVRSPASIDRVDVAVVDHPSKIEWRDGDVVVLATKGQHTEGCLADLVAAGAPPTTPIVCMQNGVANEAAALRRFEHVYGITVMFPSAHLTPGVVDAASAPISGLLDIGRYPTGVDDTARGVAEALSAATFVSEPRPDIMAWKHRKLIMNLANAVDALVERSDDSYALMAEAQAEGENVLEAAGIDVIAADVDRERRGDLLTPGPIGDEPRGGGSSWQSLARGTGDIEADYLNGEIALRARLAGVPAPINAGLQRAAIAAARRGDRPRSWSLDELRRWCGP